MPLIFFNSMCVFTVFLSFCLSYEKHGINLKLIKKKNMGIFITFFVFYLFVSEIHRNFALAILGMRAGTCK